MHFCPICGSLLVICCHDNHYAFSCRTCNYIHKINMPLRRRVEFEMRAEDHVFNKEDELKFANICEKRCKCGCEKAAYYQMQTRSADEPMTILYRCINCKATSKE